MANIKLTLTYDGTDFAGWQVQPGLPTIQGTLADVLEKLTQQRPVIQAAGRTDAGVHATGQVANFQTDSNLSAGDFQRALNALLPHSIRVLAAEQVRADFHARRDALAKTYCYSIFRGQVVSPFLWRYVHHIPYELNYTAMAEAARTFEGEHDFTSFAASTGSEDEDRQRTMTRLIYRSEMLRIPAEQSDASTEQWIYLVRGRSFLRYMVRKITGTLVEVGRGKLRPEDIPKIFEKLDRSESGSTMPPQGLCLTEVEYPEQPRLVLQE